MPDGTESTKVMPTPEEALGTVLGNLPPPSAVVKAARESAGHILAGDVLCDIDMPPFDRSAMDGYALAGESDSYEILGEIPAGASGGAALSPGQAAPIMTGAPVPEGADRVLMLEASMVDGGRLRAVTMPAPAENVCFRGEDIAAGARILSRGDLLDSKAAGLAAMAGMTSLPVYGRPAAAILTTGSEVIPPGQRPGPGQVRNANSPMLSSLLLECGLRQGPAAHVPDDPGRTSEAALALLGSADILLVAGGISLGAYDHVAPALEAAGVRFLFREVAQKPGKPFSFGLANGKPVFCLPGNPVSVFCTFQEYVAPAVRLMSGHPDFRRRRFEGVSRFTHRQKRGRTNFLRVTARSGGAGWVLDMPATSGSGDLMSTAGTNALAICDGALDGVSPGDVVPFSFNAGREPGICWT